jgi:predicted DNA-binding protein
MQRQRHVEVRTRERTPSLPVALHLQNPKHDIVAGESSDHACARYAPESAYLNHAPPGTPTMSETRLNGRRRAGRPPAGAKHGEKVRDYPQLSIRIPQEFKARLNALSAVTGLAQWRVIVQAIECFFKDLPEPDQALVDGLSKRYTRAG